MRLQGEFEIDHSDLRMKGLTVHFLTSSSLVTRPQEPRARLLYKIVFIGGTAWYSRLVLKDNCNLNKARHVRWVDTAVLSRLSRQNVTTYRNVTVLGMAWHDCRLIEMTSHTTSLTGKCSKKVTPFKDCLA